MLNKMKILPLKKDQISLNFIWIVPFVLQIFVAVSLIGYLSYKNGEKTVNQLMEQLTQEIGSKVEQNLHFYLETPHEINRHNLALIQGNFLNLDNLEPWEKHLWRQIKLYENLAFTFVATEKGQQRTGERGKQDTFLINVITGENDFEFRSYNTNELGEKTSLNTVLPNKNPVETDWYQRSVSTSQSIWSPLNVSYLEDILVMYALQSIDTDNDGNFEGILNTAIKLDQIGEFLGELTIGKSGQAFIINKQGQLIANSTGETPFNSLTKEVLVAENSTDALTEFVTKLLVEKFNNLTAISQAQEIKFRFNNEKYFTQVIPYQDNYGLDWLIVLSVPESDFMSEINANTRTTIQLCLLALVIAIVVGFFTARWISRPLHNLANASRAISEGNLDQRVEVKGVKELTILSESFNQMAKQLVTYFNDLEKAKNELEERVLERTKQLQEAKAKAEVANQAKSAFIANMSHELRTPLNAILGFSQIMMRSPNLDQEHRENIQIINRSGDYLLTLINNILDLSKIEAGKITLHKKNFDLHKLLEDLEDLLQLRAENKNLQLIFDHNDQVPQYIRTDETKLRQVLINLINNGIKFTEMGGISVRVGLPSQNPTQEDNQTMLIFEVEDTGPGIPETEIEEVFEAFIQTESGKNSQEGTGLGLAISRRFINLMDGDISVKSTLGKGTTFRFEILVTVVTKAEVEDKQIVRHVIALKPDQPCYRILIVDDRDTNRLLMTKLLQPLGFDLKEASNGKEAIKIWEKWAPHLIWMDMRMPVMDGYEATQKIKGTVKGNATAIIALTASVLEEEKAIVLSAGCDDFVRKPFRQSEIFDTMAKHLGVEYIYEENNSKNQENQAKKITAQDLEIMPPAWLKQAHQACIELDDELMIELIAQIPENNSLLIQQLTNLTDSFQFKTIKQLIEKIL
jgi:signal transduction histidine kinase/DNA-binding NarL/FixJ family response regulator